MIKYAKFISETEIEFPPVNKGSIINYDIPYELLARDGYKRLIEVPKPEEFYDLTYEEGPDYITEVVTVPTEEEKEQYRRMVFVSDFFNTSLGWIRRKVSMSTGETKDFLSDLFPSIAFGVSMGATVEIITYDMPDFSHDVEDWTIYQHRRNATPQFVQECLEQLKTDF